MTEDFQKMLDAHFSIRIIGSNKTYFIKKEHMGTVKKLLSLLESDG